MSDNENFDRIMETFLSEHSHYNRNPERLIAEVWNKRTDPTAATFDNLYAALWGDDQSIEHARDNKFETLRSRANTLLEDFCEHDFMWKRLEFVPSIELDRSLKPESPTRPGAGAPRIYRILPRKRLITLPPSEYFWHTYITHDKAPLIISTEPPVFYNDELRCFFRFLDINADPLDHAAVQTQISNYLSKLQQRYPALHDALANILTSSGASYHYQPSGEVLAALLLEAWLQKRLPPKRYRDNQLAAIRLLSRQVDKGRYTSKNSIILGNLRTNSFVRACLNQYTLPITITPTSIMTAGITEPFLDTQADAFAVVTRLSNCDEHRERTLIVANDGRALYGAVRSLVNEDKLLSLFNHLNLDHHAPLPKWFQVLYRVKVSQYNESPTDLDSTIVLTRSATSRQACG